MCAAAADIIIFLDVPRHISCARALKRNARYLFQSRPELPENCPELKLMPQLLMLIWQFKTRTRPAILRDIQSHNGKSFIVSDDKEREQVLAQLRF